MQLDDGRFLMAAQRYDKLLQVSRCARLSAAEVEITLEFLREFFYFLFQVKLQDVQLKSVCGNVKSLIFLNGTIITLFLLLIYVRI